MIRLMGSVVTVACLATRALSAQSSSSTASPPAPPTPAQMVAGLVAHLTSQLGLTADQQTEATAIFTAEQNTLSGILSSVRNARSALKTAIEANDSAAIAAQATAIGYLTEQQVLAQSTAQAAFYLVLTGAQQAAYAPMVGSGPGFGGPGGPGFGGPHGPPPTQ